MIAGISSARTTKVSRRTPTATVAPIWISSSSGSRVQGGEGAGEDQPGAGDDAAGGDQRPQRALAGAVDARLLAHPRHQEDVVVDAQRDEEDEGEQGQVEGDPFAAELRRRRRSRGRACRRRRGRRWRSGRAARRSPAAPPPGSARRRAGPAARSGGCRGRWSARRPSSPPGGRRAGRSARARAGVRGPSPPLRRLRPSRGCRRGSTTTTAVPSSPLGRHRDRQADRVEALHRPRRPARLRRPGRRRSAARPRPGREVFVQHRGAFARVGRLGLALAEADRAVVDEVAARRGRGGRR